MKKYSVSLFAGILGILLTGDLLAAEISSMRPIKLGSLPADAAIVFTMGDGPHVPGSPPPRHQAIYVMNAEGGNVTRLTLNPQPRLYEHVVVSPDRKFIIANFRDGRRPRDRRSQLWIIDLERKMEARLVPSFDSAGDGGIDWDRNGYIYFPGTREKPSGKGWPVSELFRIRYDGTGLQQLTDTREIEKDVSVSEDGMMIAYVRAAVAPGARRAHTEVWIARSDGSAARMVYKSGTVGVKSAHDPELSPDNRRIVFSQVNSSYKNFPRTYNTAHDLWVIDVDGTGLRRITPEGGLRIVPDWIDDRVLFADRTEADNFEGAAVTSPSGGTLKRIGPPGVRLPKWIPVAAAGVSGAASPSSPEPAAEPSAAPVTSARITIAAIQNLLTALGYEPGAADGVLGQRTRLAIAAFQGREGLPVDGEPTGELLLRLSVAVRNSR